jgi:cyclophilin family peptidyl-prolyl cis-trans isomerase
VRRLTVWGLLTFVLALAVPAGAQATCTPDLTNPILRFSTTAGIIDVQLDTTDTPCTVNNFLWYVDKGLYNGTFFHRSVNPAISTNDPDVIQGGDYTLPKTGPPVGLSETNGDIDNEYSSDEPNTAGTIAMAMSGTPSTTCDQDNTAENQFYFNVTDNSSGLDPDCFTAFGQVLDPTSMAVVKAIAADQVCSLSVQWDDTTGVFATVPTIGYPAGTCGTSGTPKAPPTTENATAANLIFINSITVLRDTTAPAITITSPVQRETLNFGQKVTPAYSCNDGTGTGVEACSGPSTVDTDLYGTIQYTVASEDYAGNTGTKTVTYIVELPPAVQSVGTVSSKGVLSTTIHCPSSVACVGTAGLVTRKPAAIIGTARFDIRSGGTASVRVSLTGAGWTMFRAAKWRLPATLVITPSGTGSQSSSRRITLTKAKPKPKPKKNKKPKKKKKKKK